MEVRILYRYINHDGNRETLYRITAPPGQLVTKDGVNLYHSIDTNSLIGWYTVDESIIHSM